MDPEIPTEEEQADEVEAEAEEGQAEETTASAAAIDSGPKKYRCERCSYSADVSWKHERCPGCLTWSNITSKRAPHERRQRMTLGDPSRAGKMVYHSTKIAEVDKVLSGGIVFGKIVLLAGIRGGGKTRVALQIADGIASARYKVVFRSGEDDTTSVAQFADQLGIKNEHIDVAGEPDGINVVDLTDELEEDPAVKLVILDSVQTCHVPDKKGEVGRTSQIEMVINHLSWFAKKKKVAFLVIGQLTVEDDLAGGAKFQHGVDVLTRFDSHTIENKDGHPMEGTGQWDPKGEWQSRVRVLWCPGKSRQGGTFATSYLEMSDEGKLVPLSRNLRLAMSKLEIVS